MASADATVRAAAPPRRHQHWGAVLGPIDAGRRVEATKHPKRSIWCSRWVQAQEAGTRQESVVAVNDLGGRERSRRIVGPATCASQDLIRRSPRGKPRQSVQVSFNIHLVVPGRFAESDTVSLIQQDGFAL